LKVVIAEDNPALLSLMVGLMETEFAVVATAENGLLALKRIRKYRPDIVVLDLRMPLVNGIEVARHLTKSTSKPCIVICSADTEPEIIQLSRQAGALAYVFKIRMGRDLIAAVKAALQGETFVSSR
jgi:DNA-binding NarL/FixJ family response regulator